MLRRFPDEVTPHGIKFIFGKSGGLPGGVVVGGSVF